MRKIGIIALISVSSVLATSPAEAIPIASEMAMLSATSSSADQGIINFCKGDVPNFPTEHLGNCVAIQSTLARGSNGSVPNICLFVQNVAPDFFDMYYASIAQCVQDGASFGG